MSLKVRQREREGNEEEKKLRMRNGRDSGI